MGTRSRCSCRQAPRGTPLVSAFLAVVLASAPGSAVENPSPPSPAPSAPSATGAAPQLPDPYKLNMLIRTTLIALSQANQTGNYSVLRDLATPKFQSMNSDARLGEIFAGLRLRNLDFSPVLFFDPKLVRPAAIQANGLLRLTGFIDTRPERILFDMGFELVEGTWRLSAIIVDMNTPAAEQKQETPAAQAKNPPAKADTKAKATPKN